MMRRTGKGKALWHKGRKYAGPLQHDHKPSTHNCQFAKKGKRHMTDNMTQGTVLERFLYHCKTWNNHKNNILKDKRSWKRI